MVWPFRLKSVFCLDKFTIKHNNANNALQTKKMLENVNIQSNYSSRILSFLAIFTSCTWASVSSPCYCYSETSTSPGEYQQWFTGPILTPTPITMPVGHPGLEVAWLAGQTYGTYNSHWKVDRIPKMWTTGPYVDFQIGFNKVLGAEYIGAILTSFCKGSHSTHLVDSIVRFGFQISTDQPNSWIPDFRILLQETFPTGKYQRLSLDMWGTDCSGEGSFRTGMHLAFQKLFHPVEDHDFRLRCSFGYFFPAPVTVHGLNCFGGSDESKGKIYPGQYFTGFLCGEYALSRTWALCVESNYQFGASGRYSRKRGPEIEVPSYSQISIAPEIQHTFTPQLGILMGAWLSVAGKNSTAFTDYFISMLYSF